MIKISQLRPGKLYWCLGYGPREFVRISPMCGNVITSPSQTAVEMRGFRGASAHIQLFEISEIDMEQMYTFMRIAKNTASDLFEWVESFGWKLVTLKGTMPHEETHRYPN